MDYAAAAETVMFDICKIGVPTYGTGVDSNVATYVYGAEQVCGIRETTSLERNDPTIGLTVNDAVMRLPLGVIVDSDYRIKLIERFGEAVDIDYAVIGVRVVGKSNNEVLLKRIHGGSAL